MKNVLVIGGAGFIGINILKQIIKKEDSQITLADNFSRGKMDEDLKTLVEENNIRVIDADLSDPNAFKQLADSYHQLYMLAAVVGVEYTEKMPNEIIRINTMLTMNVLEWIKTHKVDKVLFTSSSECYAGTIEQFGYTIPTPEDVPLCIDDIKNPRFTYAVTKMLGESGFFNYSKVFDFDCTVIRYHNVYGPRMGFKHVVPQVVQRILKKETPFMVYGHDQTRSFSYIDDAAKATVLAMDSEKTNGEILHIGSMHDEIPIRTLIEFIGEQLNYEGEYKNVEAPKGSVSRRCPDTTKAEKLLGYKPEFSWQEGVSITVKWYKEYLENDGYVFE